MTARRRTTGAALPHEAATRLPDGRTLSEGDEFTVKGEGRYAFAYEYLPDGSVTAYGPVGAHHRSWRSFRPERITTIHRIRKSRKSSE